MAFRYAFCNEAFTDWDFARICDYLAEHGYQGVEAAPFTFEQSVFDISAEQRASARQAAANAGLEIVGLHWLLVGPDGLHLTHPDSAVRQRTADYLRGLISFGHDLNSPYLVFGSPNQRNLPEGVSFEQGMAYATEVFEERLRRKRNRPVPSLPSNRWRRRCASSSPPRRKARTSCAGSTTRTSSCTST